MLGRSVFESVLERLRMEAEEPGPAPDTAPGPYFKPQPAFAVLGATGPAASTAGAANAYRAVLEDDAGDRAETAPAAPPPHYLRTAPEEVAADLGLTGTETKAELGDIRRAFARLNHPDGAPPELRSNADRRMMIANMLIDETLRRMKVKDALGAKP